MDGSYEKKVVSKTSPTAVAPTEAWFAAEIDPDAAGTSLPVPSRLRPH